MNLMLITADQWRGDCLSAVGHPVVKTPWLDNIASEGLLFRRHYANAVPCGPSRASLHTGTYLHNHRSGTNGTPLDERFTNWARELRSAGYDPVLFGYTHTAPDPRGKPVDDPRLWNEEGILPGIRPIVGMGTLCPEWRAFLTDHGYVIPDQQAATYGAKAEDHAGPQAPRALRYLAQHSDTRFLTDSAVSYIRENKAHPWCVHLSLRAPHPPWVAPAPYHQRYALDSLPAPVSHETVEREQWGHPWIAEHLNSPRNRRHGDVRRHQMLQASYYGLMSEVDDNMGRLVEWLKAEGQWDQTLLIFTSDHGEQMGDHWMYGKAGYFDQSYHIPLIIKGPGLCVGRSELFTEHVDLTPTILELFGVPIPRQCDGHSLGPHLRGGVASDWRDAVHFEFDFRHSEAESTLGLPMESACLGVIRDERYKYVHFADLPELLFDLASDPGELENIAEENPDLVARYAKRLLSWRMKTTDKTLSHMRITADQGLVTRE